MLCACGVSSGRRSDNRVSHCILHEYLRYYFPTYLHDYSLRRVVHYLGRVSPHLYIIPLPSCLLLQVTAKFYSPFNTKNFFKQGAIISGYYDIVVDQTITLRSTVALPAGTMVLSATYVAPDPTTTAALSIASSRIVSISSGITGTYNTH